jgi:hypothetical protein
MKRAPRMSALVAAGLLAAGCATTTPGPSASVSVPSITGASPTLSPGPSLTPPAPTLAPPPSLGGLVTCGAPDLDFPAELLDGPSDAQLGLDAPAAALRAYLDADTPDEGLVPRTGWRIVIAEPDRVVYLAPDADGWAMASFVRGDAGWELGELGSCRLEVRLPDGIGFAEWRLDPERLPDAAATTLHLLATERACAGGRPPLGRLLPSFVVATERAITIAIEVRQGPGVQTCPGNPEVPVDVELEAPLGARGLYDGSTVPPSERLAAG